MSTTIAVRCVVTGRVQGVFYRAASAERAAGLALSGWARNLADGRVEVVVEGDANAVSSLSAWLWQGPPAARVQGVVVEDWPGEVPRGFRIL